MSCIYNIRSKNSEQFIYTQIHTYTHVALDGDNEKEITMCSAFYWHKKNDVLIGYEFLSFYAF
jgi:hypothetical protein